MDVFLGTSEYGTYTITVIEMTEEACKKKLLTAFNKAMGKRMTAEEYGDYYGWDVTKMKVGKAEWL